MVTDPIADFLTRVRNAQMAGHRIVEIPASNLKKRMTEILYNQGYILKYKFEDDTKQGLIKIALKYDAVTKEPRVCVKDSLLSFFYFLRLIQLHRDGLALITRQELRRLKYLIDAHNRSAARDRHIRHGSGFELVNRSLKNKARLVS